MKIVVLDGAALNPGDLSWDWLGEIGEYTVYPRTDTAEEAIERIGDCEIVLTNKTPIDADILDRCPCIRYIGVLATGYNVVDVTATRERGIPVTNVASYGTESVAQFTFALLLEICHRVGLHDEAVHHGAWEQSPVFSFWLTQQRELAGKPWASSDWDGSEWPLQSWHTPLAWRYWPIPGQKKRASSVWSWIPCCGARM